MNSGLNILHSDVLDCYFKWTSCIKRKFNLQRPKSFINLERHYIQMSKWPPAENSWNLFFFLNVTNLLKINTEDWCSFYDVLFKLSIFRSLFCAPNFEATNLFYFFSRILALCSCFSLIWASSQLISFNTPFQYF